MGGAGVSYGIGQWISDGMRKKGSVLPGDGATMDQLPWAAQVALKQWQAFLDERSIGRQLSAVEVQQAWAEFERAQPTHARNCHVQARGAETHLARSGPGI